jgi:hypothetical protein
MAQQPPVGQDLLIIEDSWSHADTPHSVGLLWTSDQPDAETSTWQHTTPTTSIHATGDIRTHNPRKRAAADPLFRPRGDWDRMFIFKAYLLPDDHNTNTNYLALITHISLIVYTAKMLTSQSKHHSWKERKECKSAQRHVWNSRLLVAIRPFLNATIETHFM